MTLIAILLIILSYLIGSINSAIIICKLFDLPSPRTVGSGNPGATNVLRLGSKPAAALTLLGDLLKGVIPVLIAKWLFHSDLLFGIVGLAAVLGHLFPIWFKFKGGKGVATTIGVLLALDLGLGAAFILTWLIIAFLFRYSSLAAIIAIALAPFYAWAMIDFSVMIPLLVISILVIYRHRENIGRLLARTESKITLKRD